MRIVVEVEALRAMARRYGRRTAMEMLLKAAERRGRGGELELGEELPGVGFLDGETGAGFPLDSLPVPVEYPRSVSKATGGRYNDETDKSAAPLAPAAAALDASPAGTSRSAGADGYVVGEMWRAMTARLPLGPAVRLTPARRKKLAAFWSEHLAGLPSPEARTGFWLEVLEALRLDPWWGVRPRSLLPEHSLRNPERRDQWAMAAAGSRGGPAAGAGEEGSTLGKINDRTV